MAIGWGSRIGGWWGRGDHHRPPKRRQQRPAQGHDLMVTTKEHGTMVITVTGSTGNIGSELVRNLSGAGASVRAILRNPTRAAPTLSGVVWARADLAREDLLDAALAGTTRLFVLTGNQPGFGRIQTGVIRAAERHGVQH